MKAEVIKHKNKIWLIRFYRDECRKAIKISKQKQQKHNHQYTTIMHTYPI
jgi:hypothetical protein